MKHEGWAEFGLQIAPEHAATLDTYLTLLLERAVPQGMIAASDSSRLRERHILDSLRAVSLFSNSDSSAIDLGSGAGLPGIPLAIACPGTSFTLVESRHRRAAFLEFAIDRLGLENASVIRGRAEVLTIKAEVCLARAFAAPARCWQVADGLLTAGGRLIYWAGESFYPESLRVSLTGSVKVVTAAAPTLERLGPLVMMCRQ